MLKNLVFFLIIFFPILNITFIYIARKNLYDSVVQIFLGQMGLFFPNNYYESSNN